MKKWKVMVSLLLISMLLGQKIVKVQATEVYTPNIILAEMMDMVKGVPGETVAFKVPVKSIRYYAKTPVITVKFNNENFEVVSDITLSGATNETPKNISTIQTTYVNFKVKIKDGARKGDYNPTIDFVTTDSSGGYCKVTMDSSTPIILRVTEEKKLPDIRLISSEYENHITAGQKFDIGLIFENKGELDAKKVKVTLDGYTEAGLIPESHCDYIELGKLDVAQREEIIFPVTAARSLTSGIKTINAVITGETEDGTAINSTVKFYLEVPSGGDDAGILINEIKQNPESPQAGEKMSISFYLKNETGSAMKEIKIATENVSTDTFVPVSSSPYVYVDEVKNGKKVKVTLDYSLSKVIQEGMHTLNVKYTYLDASGASKQGTVNFYVLNVVNNTADTLNSIPKLIIENYDLGVETLKAGDVFNFDFDVKNAHKSARANNIKVTISSDDNVFSITGGSNNFYISSMSAGEVTHNSMPLKVATSAASKSYPLKIKFEYEYDGIDTETTGKEISKQNTIEEILNIPVLENARPVVSNITMGYGEEVFLGEMTTLSFEFYNMGKSTLYNVTARLEGDYTPSTEMLYIGNVEAGNGQTWEWDVTPEVEGEAMLNLIVSYEDSNGNAVELAQDDTSNVTGMSMPTDDYGMEEIPEEIPQQSTFPWKFVIGGVIVAAVGAAALLVWKKHKKKKGMDEDEDD